jgi:hypothetical protein
MAQQQKETIQPVQAIAPVGAMCVVQVGQSFLFAQCTTHKAFMTEHCYAQG